MRGVLSCAVLSGKEQPVNIYITGCPGTERALALLNEHRAVLSERFPEFFLRRLETAGKKKAAPPEGDFYVREILKGGLFGALWAAGEDLGCGLCVNVCDVPVMQEAVEIMELYNENPYESSSAGIFLIISSSEKKLPEGVVKIGETNNKKSRTVQGPAGIRYITPPGRQEKDIAVRSTAR